MDRFIGKRLDGRYEFVELIGCGGMANVYRAYDCVKSCNVAIKVLKDEYSKDREFIRRFRNESKANASLSHPNIVRIYDVGFGDKVQYIVMEYIDGVTLKDFINKVKVLNWKDVVHFTLQILRALQHAHDKGIVHRDIKPQNIMLLSDGTIKVTDFGIARFSSDEKVSYDRAIGSVHYISPEQASGGVTDERSDIYSLGIMIYEMLTGELPFNGSTPESVAVQQIEIVAKSPLALNSDIPKGLVDIVERAMKKKPEERYQSTTEMLRDVYDFKNNPSVKFDYKYLTSDGNTKYFTVSDKNNMKRSNDYNFSKNSEKVAKKKDKLIPVLIGIAGGFVLVAIIITIIFVLSSKGDSGEIISMPNLVGSKIEDIRTMDNGKYKNLEISVEQLPNSKYDSGVIFEQEPVPGIKIKSNYDGVKLKVSSGEEIRPVPNVCNMPVSNAKSKLKSLGFTVIKTVEKEDVDVVENYVISTKPAAGEQASLGTEIVIYYSSGSGKMVDVPNVVGKDFETGKAVLESAGFKVVVVEKFVEGKQKGSIVEQNSSGKAEAGSSVKVIVNSAKKDSDGELNENSNSSEVSNKKSEVSSKKKEKSTSKKVEVPFVCYKPMNGNFNVSICNDHGKVISSEEYSVGEKSKIICEVKTDVAGTYTIKAENKSTGKTVVYGTIDVKPGSDGGEPSIHPFIDRGALAKTEEKTDKSNNSRQ